MSVGYSREPLPPKVPWEHFEFSERPTLVRSARMERVGLGGVGGVTRALPRSEGKPWYPGPQYREGKPITWGVVHDGRVVPFKIITPRSPADYVPFVERPALVLLHGMGINAATFAGISPWLLKTHDLVLVDYSSFSAPERWPWGGVSLRLLAAGIWRVIHTLGLKQVSLLGSSLGGGLALLMTTMMRPGTCTVEKIALLNPAVYAQQLPRMYRLARVPVLGELLMALMPAEKLVEGVAWIGYSSPEKMPEELRESYTRTMRRRANRWQLMDLMRHLPANGRDKTDIAEDLERITQPTLILWGTLEKLLPADTGRRLASTLPHARLLEFEELGHLPHEEGPEQIGPLVAIFLAPPPTMTTT